MKTTLLTSLTVFVLLQGCSTQTPPALPASTEATANPVAATVPPPREGFDSGFNPVMETASIDESVIQEVIHVLAGARGGDGSEGRPYGSLNEARGALLRRLEAGTPVRLRIGPGKYREDLNDFLRLKNASRTVQDTVLVIEGSAKGDTVFSGSVPFDATWEKWEGDETLWFAPWPYQWTPDPGPWVATFGHPEITGETARREALIVEGKSLRLRAMEKWSWHQPGGASGADAAGRPLGQVNPGSMQFDGMVSEDPAEMLRAPGEFTVVSHPEAPAKLRGRIFVRRAPGEGPPQQVEVPLLRHPDAPWMRIAFKNNLVIRHLVFTHTNGGYLSPGLLVTDARNLIIEDCTFVENVNVGLQVQRSERVLLRRVVAEHNGQKGMGVGGCRNVVLEDCATHFNNYRGHWTNFRRWDPAGIKLGDVHQIEFRRHAAIGNYGGGIWWDVYCTDMLVDRSLLYGNGRLGVEMELAAPQKGNWEIRNSVVAWNTGAGVFVSMAANVRVLNNVLAHNGGGELEGEISYGQIVYKTHRHAHKGPRSAEDWSAVTVRDNLFFADPGQHFVSFLRRRIQPAEQFPFVLDVLDTDHNRYVSADASAGFSLIEERFGDFAAWKDLLAARQPGRTREVQSVREQGKAPDLAAWAQLLGTPWPAEQIQAWHELRESGVFALDQFGL